MDKVFLKIGYSTAIQTVGKLISISLSFLTVGLLTRYLGTSGYGNFTLVFSYLAFFSTIADFGTQLAMVKELSSTKETFKHLYGTYLRVKLFLVFIASVTGLLVLLFFPYSDMLKTGIVIGTLAVSVSGITSYFGAIFQSRLRFDLLMLVDLSTKLITAIFIILFIVLKLDFYFILATVLIGNLFGFFLASFLLKDTLSTSYDLGVAKKLIAMSIPIGITSFISLLYFKVDVILLSLYKSPNDVGVYSLAYRILENMIVFWGFYMASVYPMLSKFRETNKNQYNRLIKNSILIALFSSIPIIVITLIFSPLIIQVFGGKQFGNSIPALNILIFSIPFLFINNIFYNFYILERRNIIIGVAILSSLVLNVVLNVIFIPQYGYIASSYITAVSAMVLTLSYIAGLKFINRVRDL